MSNFLFGVAFERLLFSALNRYLLKNSSSIETEMRSLILPLESTHDYASLEYLSLYLEADRLRLSANCGSLRQSPELCIFHARQCERPKEGTIGYFGEPDESYNCDFSSVLEPFMRSRECGRSKQLSSSYSRPGYSGSRSSFR